MSTKAQTVQYNRPWLAPYQLKALFEAERIAVVEATTKAGKTVGCMVWITEQALGGGKGKNYWWIAPTIDVSKIAFRRLKHALPQNVYTCNENDRTITLLNGATVWFKGAEKPDHLYGEDVYAAVIDEATRCKEEAWHAIRTTLTATRAPVRIIGNVKGRKNWAYKLARRAQAGEPGYSYAKITADDAVAAGILDADEIESARRDLPKAIFDELYYAKASDDEGNPFGFDAIHNCIAAMSSNRPKVFGLDVARSRDWMVLIGLDANGYVCYFDRWHGPAEDPKYWQKSIARVVKAVGHSGAITLVDATTIGDQTLESLRKEGEPYGQTYLGYVFTAKSKQALMERLAIVIQQETVHYPDGPIVEELELFEYEYRRNGVSYSAPEGFHDDCVCSLALAAWQMKQVHYTLVDIDTSMMGVVGSSKPLTIERNV